MRSSGNQEIPYKAQKLYEFNPLTNLVKLGKIGKIRQLISSFLKLNRAVVDGQFDVVVTLNLEPNFLILVHKLLIGGNYKVVTTEHTDLVSYYSYSNPLKKIFKSLVSVLYRCSDFYVGCSKSVTKSLVKAYSLPELKARTVYNSLREEFYKEYPVPSSTEKYICSLGRLDEKKGYKELILALSSYLKDKNLKLKIAGDGPLKKELQRLIQTENLQDHVELLGFVTNPVELVRNSWAYVSSSYLEGMPLNIVEAMSMGVPVVATDCNSGPREILAPESDLSQKVQSSYQVYSCGILVPTPDLFEKFKSGMILALQLLEDQGLYHDIARSSKNRIVRFKKDSVQQDWNKLFKELAVL